ncbi:helix-turn-helix transcriptional regulator [Catenulispora subtropica]|uniref:Helix-turn-helix transcriptional regulator n=1 Tax=Catenulispora subtropica TaxID=450798 RepID=A0ABN2RRW0_9ACTN
MEDAGISAREVARRCNWHESKSSRLLSGTTPPSESDIRLWCTACDADSQAADLVAASKAAESSYASWSRIQREGLRQSQRQYIPLYERTKVIKVYTSNVIPGLLQTPDYASALMSTIVDYRGIVNDVEAAVAARVERSKVVNDGYHRCVFLIEESVLRNRFGDVDTMTAQLGSLLTILGRPNVVLGIIPSGSQRDQGMWTVETFMIFDEAEVQVELLAAFVTVTAPSEIQSYESAFSRFGSMAVYGRDATKLITAAIEALG